MEEKKKTERVAVAFANEGSQYIDVEIIQKWQPEKVSKMGSTTFFKVGDTFVSMETKDYNKIFG